MEHYNIKNKLGTPDKTRHLEFWTKKIQINETTTTTTSLLLEFEAKRRIQHERECDVLCVMSEVELILQYQVL